MHGDGHHILIVSGLETNEPLREFRGSEISVGRFEPGSGGSLLNLARDGMASRMHAVVRLVLGQWLLTDERSTNGTFVNGTQVSSEVPTQIEPGDPVRTGDSVWTIVPSDWLLFSSGNIHVFGRCSPVVYYAGWHCGERVIDGMHAANSGDRDSEALHVEMEIEGYSHPCLLDVPRLRPGEIVPLPPPHLALKPQKLRTNANPSRVSVLATIAGSGKPVVVSESVVLGYWDWPHGGDPCVLAAFASPLDPHIERIVHEMEQEHGSLRRLLQSRDSDKYESCVRAFYETLRDKCSITYTDARPKTLDRLGVTYQTVKPARSIFPDQENLIGAGTCLDLALLLSSCLERVGLLPIIVLIGESEGRPEHAMAGCWLDSRPGRAMLIEEDSADVRTLPCMVDDGCLLLLECTGFATTGCATLTFEESASKAKSLLSASGWACAVDIGALRREGRITPMDSPLDLEVAASYVAAEAFAASKMRKTLQLTHLLYGILNVAGPVSAEAFRAADYDPEKLAMCIDNLPWGATEVAGAAPEPTAGYIACQYLAEQYSWQQRSSSVRESDLLWALIEQGGSSTTLATTCERIGLDMRKVSDALAASHPPPIMGDDSSRVEEGQTPRPDDQCEDP